MDFDNVYNVGSVGNMTMLLGFEVNNIFIGEITTIGTQEDLIYLCELFLNEAKATKGFLWRSYMQLSYCSNRTEKYSLKEFEELLGYSYWCKDLTTVYVYAYPFLSLFLKYGDVMSIEQVEDGNYKMSFVVYGDDTLKLVGVL